VCRVVEHYNQHVNGGLNVQRSAGGRRSV
jgi:hypothetical protein